MSRKLCVLFLIYACRLELITLECCNEVGSFNLELLSWSRSSLSTARCEAALPQPAQPRGDQLLHCHRGQLHTELPELPEL
jgi:hypothetical protein